MIRAGCRNDDALLDRLGGLFDNLLWLRLGLAYRFHLSQQLIVTAVIRQGNKKALILVSISRMPWFLIWDLK